MPDWVIGLLMAVIASTPGLAALLNAASKARQDKEQAPLQQKQMLQAVADTASATALRCLESATKELHLQLDETRDLVSDLRARLAETERQLVTLRQQLEDTQAENAQSEARLQGKIRTLEAERAALLLRIEELEGKA
jgi:predicted  nucleic acid-binding Zn-ribbon protein